MMISTLVPLLGVFPFIYLFIYFSRIKVNNLCLGVTSRQCLISPVPTLPKIIAFMKEKEAKINK